MCWWQGRVARIVNGREIIGDRADGNRCANLHAVGVDIRIGRAVETNVKSLPRAAVPAIWLTSAVTLLIVMHLSPPWR